MTEPDDWAEMILTIELKKLSKDYVRLTTITKGGKNGETNAALNEIAKRMQNVEGVLEIISKLNLNLNVKNESTDHTD